MAACAAAQLKATTGQTTAAAGTVYIPIDFTNVSPTACTMYGYPGVSLVTTPGGKQVGSAATRNAMYQPVTVTVSPGGGHAHAAVLISRAANYDPSQCQPATAHWLRIYPPGAYSPVYAAYTAQVCSAKLPSNASSEVQVTAVQAGQ